MLPAARGPSFATARVPGEQDEQSAPPCDPDQLYIDHAGGRMHNVWRSATQFLIVEDNRLFGATLVAKLGRWGTTTWATDYDEAMRSISERTYSVLFVDVRLPTRSGLDVLREFRRRHPATPAMVLTGYFEQADSVTACCLRAQYVVKPITLAALEAFVVACDCRERLASQAPPHRGYAVAAPSAAEREPPSSNLGFTRAEYAVYALLLERLSNREIAEILHISVETVRTHVHRVLAKLGVHSRIDAINARL